MFWQVTNFDFFYHLSKHFFITFGKKNIDSMDRKYYEEYYQLERKHWWFQVRGHLLMDIVRKQSKGAKNLKILNIGAATGLTSQLLQEFGEVTSVEYDQECSDFTREKIGINIQQGTILDLAFADQSFDLVCAFDVIEHVEDDHLAVREMKRVCKTGGIVFVAVPAFMWLWSHHDVVCHHYRRYTMKSLLAVFNKQNIGQIVYKTYFNSALFLPIAAFRLLSRLIPQAWIRSGAGTDNTLISTESATSKLLYAIFNAEKNLMKNGMKFPFGVSVTVCCQV